MSMFKYQTEQRNAIKIAMRPHLRPGRQIDEAFELLEIAATEALRHHDEEKAAAEEEEKIVDELRRIVGVLRKCRERMEPRKGLPADLMEVVDRHRRTVEEIEDNLRKYSDVPTVLRAALGKSKGGRPSTTYAVPFAEVCLYIWCEFTGLPPQSVRGRVTRRDDRMVDESHANLTAFIDAATPDFLRNGSNVIGMRAARYAQEVYGKLALGDDGFPFNVPRIRSR